MTASGNGNSPNGKAPLADWATSPRWRRHRAPLHG